MKTLRPAKELRTRYTRIHKDEKYKKYIADVMREIESHAQINEPVEDAEGRNESFPKVDNLTITLIPNKVEGWLSDLGFHQYWRGFENDGWTDAEIVKLGLADRTEGDALLQKLGVDKGGHRLKILISLHLLD
jgi:hypothetical protein